MPTILDSLLVTLGLKADDFHKEKKKVKSGLNDLTKSAAKFLAVIGGTYEIKKFIQNQIEASSALDRLSKNLNESASAISDWSNATELAGGSAEGLQGTLKMLSAAQTELQLTGESRLIPYFAALGISLVNANGPMGNLLDLADRFGRMNRTTAYNLGKMMGIDEGTLQLLLKGRAAVEEYLRIEQKYAITSEQAAEATRLRTALVLVQQTFKAVGRTLMQDVSPIIEKVFQAFQDFGDWCLSHKQIVEAFFTVMVVGIGAISVAAIPISAAAVAFVAFGAALALAWEDYQVWKNGGSSLFNWAPAVNLAAMAFHSLGNAIQTTLRGLINLGIAIMAIKDGNWSIAKDALLSSGGVSSGNARSRFITSAASKLGVPASAIDAQLRLETGSGGGSAIGSFNYGNIKAGSGYGGNTVSKDVKEYGPGGYQFTDRAQFRSYATPEEAAADYAAMIQRKFPGAVGAQSAAAFARGLQAGGYATDPNYVNKVSSIAAGIPGASGAAAGAAGGMSYPVAGNRSSSVTIGEVNVQTAATDANGIAKDMGKSLDYLFTSQANYGLR